MHNSIKNGLNKEPHRSIIEKSSAEKQALLHVLQLIGYPDDSDSDTSDVMTAVDEARKKEAYALLFRAIPADIKSHTIALEQDRYFTKGIETPTGIEVKNIPTLKNKRFTLLSPLTVADRTELSPFDETTPVAKF